MLDITRSEFDNDLKYYEECLKVLIEKSIKVKIFCLVHKMDLIENTLRGKTLINYRKF